MAARRSPDTGSIPTIRFDRLDREDEIHALDAACRDWGFFQLLDHGLAAERRQRLLRMMREFFHQPAAVKRRIERTASNPWGFFDRELTKNTRDWKEIFDVGEPEHHGPLAGARPQWPEVPGFRETLVNHRSDCERIAARLLNAMARALEAPPHVVAAAFEPAHTSFLRLNFYPVCARPEAPERIEVGRSGHLGINHHTDAGALTVLVQDAVPGLQVRRADRWHTIVPKPDAVIINIGDVVQVWSNDRYRAPLHRVLANRERARLSAAYFYNPSADARYAPLPGTGEPAYRPITWGEFRTARAAGDYADAGEEIQIAQFRR